MFSSEQSLKSNCLSSSVSVRSSSSEILFGSVEYLFCHTFLGSYNSLAYIHWYDNCQLDPESGLLFVISNTTPSDRNPIIQVSQIMKNLVIAEDESEPNKIYILNHEQY